MVAKNFGFENTELKYRHNTQMVKGRLVLILSCLMLCFVIVALKSAEATIISPVTKRAKVATAAFSQARADIVDRNGTIVATTLRTASAYANAKDMINIEDAVLKLSGSIGGIDPGKLLKDLEHGSKFVWIKRNITPREQKIINDLGIPGVYFKNDVARIYPQGNLLAHVLGYVNVDNEGLAGMERSFDQALSTKTETPLKLSIDVKLQNILRDELLMQYQKYQAVGAVGMMADVRTGEIVAMVSLPDFDPNFAASATPDEKFNRATLGTYEMGSTFKPFTAANALDAGTTSLDKSYSTTPLYYDGFTIHDFEKLPGHISMLEVLMHSSNVGTGRIALELGTQKQQEFLDKLDMFVKPEIEIPEKSRTIRPRQWTQLNGITIAFGHGIALTPASLAKSYLPLFNGGHLLPITLLKRKPHEVKPIRELMQPSTIADMRTIFRAIVVGGTGRNADVPGYNVGGKTGTAEKIENGKYSKSKVMSSFIGAFPIDNPRYMVMAIIDDPKQQPGESRPTGGKVCAPVVHNVVMRTATILGIKPIRNNVIELDANGMPKNPAPNSDADAAEAPPVPAGDAPEAAQPGMLQPATTSPPATTPHD